MSATSILTLIGSLFGAAAWTAPYVYSKCSKPKLKARLVSCSGSEANVINELAYINFFALNMISLNKSFQMKDINIKVKYKGIDEYFVGDWIWLRKLILPDYPQGNLVTLEIKPEDTLPFVGTLPKDSTKLVYLLFKTKVSNLTNIEFEEIKLTFIDFKGKSQTINVTIPEESKIVYDDRIWKEVDEKTLNEIKVNIKEG